MVLAGSRHYENGDLATHPLLHVTGGEGFTGECSTSLYASGACVLMFRSLSGFADGLPRKSHRPNRGHNEFARIVRQCFDADLSPISRHQFGKPFRPLQKDQQARIEEIIEAERFHFQRFIEAVKVYVKDIVSVLMNESKGGAGDGIRGNDAEALHNTFRERRLPCPQIADQENGSAEFGSELPAESNRLLFGGRSK